MTTKFCAKCGCDKYVDEFYANASTADGLQAWCITCWKADIERRIASDPEHRRKIARESAQRTAADRAAGLRPKLVHKTKPYDEKVKARRKLQYAVRKGRIIRQPCTYCGEPNADAHHADYSKPLDVSWVCKLCHAREHRTIDGRR